MTKRRRWQPTLWASRKPFGIGEQRPNSYTDIWRTLKENRDNLAYGWRILRHGACDGCSLGSTGMRDWTIDEIHLCNVRLRLLRLNTMPALDTGRLADITTLRENTSGELRALGRLPYPMVRRRGEPGFRRAEWDEALDMIAERIRSSSPDRLAFYMTSRGEPNENYYAAQKAARAIGTNSIDNAARVCHSPSTFALKEALGVAATTCSYADWIGSDLVVFIGSNVASNQPVAMKYLYHARKHGTRVAVVNSYREPGMERYWVPSNVESALFGTKITDRFFLINVGGDVPFLNGTLKQMIKHGWADRRFIGDHTTGIEALTAALESQSWEELERLSGATRQDMEEFAQMLGQARSAVIVWGMGVTQHEVGEDNVRAIVNLGLTKGFVGREKCGLMPIRGHSGVQGGAEMGAYATVLPGGLPLSQENAQKFSSLWGFNVPQERGKVAPEQIDAAHSGELDLLFASGGNFPDVMPDPRYVEEALERVSMRVHMDIVISPQMLIDPADTVILLPAQTRYEMDGGVTQTSTERRVIFSPEIPGPRIGEARPEWEVFGEIATRAKPELADKVAFAGTAAIRADIAAAIPSYQGIQHLSKQGDQFQYGGRHLCRGWKFETADGKAHFSVVDLPQVAIPEDRFVVATRRGRQFNSMVHDRVDEITGAVREAVLMNRQDADALGLRDGDRVVLSNEFGSLSGRVCVAPISPRNLEVHWPEGQVLIDRTRHSPQAGIPDYNAFVSVQRQRESAAA